MLISYRGEFGERDPWQTEGGGVTEAVLHALNIPHQRLDDPAMWRGASARPRRWPRHRSSRWRCCCAAI